MPDIIDDKKQKKIERRKGPSHPKDETFSWPLPGLMLNLIKKEAEHSGKDITDWEK